MESRRDGQRRLYALQPELPAELDAWLAPYRQLWTEGLETLERHLDEQKMRSR